MKTEKLMYFLIGAVMVALMALIVWFVFFSDSLVKAEASQTPYKTICHHNPSQSVTLTFQNQQSYNGHLGTPHNNQTYDTNGACVTVTPTVSPSPTVTPSPTPKPVKDYCKNFKGDQEEVPYGMVSDEDRICTCDEGYHQVDENVEVSLLSREHKDDYDTFTCEKDEPEVTPSPSPTPTEQPKTESSSSVSTPTCTDGSTTQLVANMHVIRNGSQATVNFFITQGDKANIYYKVNESSSWQYSVIGVKPSSDNFVSYTINDLDSNLGYTFGAQQVIGCGSGEIATAVVIDPPANGKLFRFSFWTW